MVGVQVPLETHEDTHKGGGSDEIDSVLAATAIPSKARSIFHGAGEAVLTNATSQALDHYAAILMDAAGEKAYYNLLVPQDYTSGAVLKVVYSRITAEPQVDHYVTWASSDESLPVHNEDILDLTYTSCGADGDIGIMDIGLTFANLVAGDVIGIEMRHDTNNYYILGVILEYND